MLKAFFCLGVASAVLLALISIAVARPVQLDLILPEVADPEAFLTDEGPITPDGAVSGTDEENDYTIFQRAALNNSKIKIQGIATCNFLCMDRCGLLYGSREFTDECIFNEVMEDHYFNTYSSAKYSNDKRTMYLALNKKGQPRKVQAKTNSNLDKLETYTNVLTKAVPTERVDALEAKIYNARLLFGKFLLSGKGDAGGHHSLRHHRYQQLCVNAPMTKLDEKDKFRCRKREKRKKKRKCREEEEESEDCQNGVRKRQKSLWKCEEGEEEDECQKRLHMIRKKRKSRNGEGENWERERKRKKRLKKKFSEKTKSVKFKCQGGGEGANCGRKTEAKQEDARGSREPEAERNLDEYDAEGFTENPDTEDETGMDAIYDWTTSAAVQD